MPYWNTLSMKDKAGLIQIAVKHGLTSLDDIRAKYNEFAKGGSLSDSAYAGKMEEVAEDNYRQWGYDNPDIALIHALNDNTYDYKGYYRNTPNPDANASTHWPDTYKTAHHPTFSDESKYSGIKSEYNPLGLVGGHWYGDTFIPQAWQLAERRNNKYEDGGSLGGFVKGTVKKAVPKLIKKFLSPSVEDAAIKVDPTDEQANSWQQRYNDVGYIGGKAREVRQKYFDVDKEFTDSVNSISARYGLHPSVVASRIAEEGPVDLGINLFNDELGYGSQGALLSELKVPTKGPLWGLDDFYSRAKENRVNVTATTPYTYELRKFRNEKGRITDSVYSPEWWFGIEATAAELKARRDKLKKKNPWMDNKTLDAAASMSFNYGEYGVQKHIDDEKPIPSRFRPYINTGKKYAMGGDTDEVPADATYVAPQDPYLASLGTAQAKAYSEWREQHPVMAKIEDIAPAFIPLAAVGAATAIPAVASTAFPYIASAVSAYNASPLAPWLNMAVESGMLASAANDITHGKFTPETAVNLLPLSRAVTPVAKTVGKAVSKTRQARQAASNIGDTKLFNSLSTPESSPHYTPLYDEAEPIEEFLKQTPEQLAERGRQAFIEMTSSSWYLERLKTLYPKPGEAEKVQKRILKEAREVVFDLSQNQEQLGSLGKASVKDNVSQEKVLNGITYNPIGKFGGMKPIRLAHDSGEITETAFHELLHHTTHNEYPYTLKDIPEGYQSVMSYKMAKTPFDTDKKVLIVKDYSQPDWPVTGVDVVYKNSGRYLQDMMQKHKDLLPPVDPTVAKALEGSDEAIAKLAAEHGWKTEDIPDKLKWIKYLAKDQESRARLQTWFYDNIMRHVKNPNDAAEVEKYLIENEGELMGMAPKAIEDLMYTIYSRSNWKDWAKYFSAALSTLPFVSNVSSTKKQDDNR